MPWHIQPLRRMRTARRLLLIFGVAIVAPGLALGFLSAKALVQERRLAERQLQETLAAAADSAGTRLQSELKEWQQAADNISGSGSVGPGSWSERVRMAVREPGAAVVLIGSLDRPQAVPAGQLLYELSPLQEARPVPTPPLLTKGEYLELRDKLYEPAIVVYRQALASAKPGERAAILVRLARTLKKAGHVDDALQAYRRLEAEPPVRIGSLPSDLIAGYEVASAQHDPVRLDGAFRVYQNLIEGNWQLEKTSYAFYAAWARDLAPHTDEFRRVSDKEQRKLALTSAAERFVNEPRALCLIDGQASLAFWRSEPFAAIVLGGRFVRERLLSHVVPGLSVSVTTLDGQILAGEPLPAGQPSAASVISSANVPLRVLVWPTDATALVAAIDRQRNLYLGMVASILTLLTFGAYFTVRTVQSELAVSQLKSDFISTVSHEFRSPLAGINQLGEMLRDGRVTDEGRRREYYDMIVAETGRLRRLVENILDFSRMEEGQKQYRLESLDPSEWLRELTDDFRAQVAAAGFSIESNIPDELPAVLADREALTTAVHNLLDNAVKYSADARSVRVAAETDRTVLSISVRDCGVGISSEDGPRIFERFYRGRGEQARQVKGVGLGLNLVHHIVTAHGGTVDFQSMEGQGSTFIIRLSHATHPAG